jgi:hypothetical protein
MTKREKNLVLRVDDSEFAMIHALSDDADESIARIVRRWIRNAYVDRFGLAKPPTPKLKHAR